MSEVPMTELEAVNLLLANIGEAPVDSLDEDLPLDALQAQQKIRATMHNLMARGWYWNREITELVPDANSEIVLPRNTLAVTPVNTPTGTSYTIRGGKLYRIERGNNGYTFTAPVVLNLTLFLSFEELPAIAREYVTARAARNFNVDGPGDQLVLQNDQFDETSAWVALRADENRNSRLSLRINYNVNRIASQG